MLTEEQQAIRATGIGSSEIGIIAGLSRWGSPIDIWRRKVEGWRPEETAAMRRGHLLEPVIAQLYAEETGAELSEPGTMRHPTSKVALATPDRIATADGREPWVVEIKTASIRMLHEWGETGTDEVPPHYLAQVAWEMACADLDRAEVAVLIAGDDLRIYRLLRDRDLEGHLLEIAERWWRDYVVTRKPPPVDGSDSAAQWIAERYPEHRAPMLEATPEADAMARALRDARTRREQAERDEKELRQRLEQLIGEAEGLAGAWGRISWRRSKDRLVTDWEQVAREAGATEEIIQRHTAARPGSRVFRPTWRGEAK